METLTYFLGSLAKYAGFTSGLMCISAFIIFLLLSLSARKTSPIRKRSLYYTCSLYLLLVGIYQIFLALNMAENIDPERALFYHRMSYFFGLPTIPIFLYVVLILTMGGYKNAITSNKIKPKWRKITQHLWKPIWGLTGIVWLMNLADLITGQDILLSARTIPIADSFIPLIPVRSTNYAFFGITFVWRIWQLTFFTTVVMALAYLIRSIWFDKLQPSESDTKKKLFSKESIEVFKNGLKDNNPSIKWIKSFSLLSFLHILFTGIQGSVGYEWPHSFPIPVYSAIFLMLAFSFVLIGEIIEARENVIAAYTSSYGTRMVGIVAHELGTPLFLMRGYLNKMRNDFQKRAQKQHLDFNLAELENYVKYFDKTEKALDRLTKTVDDLKAKAGIFRTKLKPVVINDLLQEVSLNRDYNHKGKQFSFKLDIDSSIGKVVIDPEQMQVILRNLIENAIDALPDQNGSIKLTTCLSGDRVYIHVQDNGAGIPKKFLERVRDPFFTTKFKGTGLGLAIVQGFLNEIKGTLKFDSIEGEGTRVEIAIPT